MAINPEAVRSRYPAGSYTAAGNPVSVDQLKVRTMNFGQHWRGEAVVNLPYSFRLPLQLGIDILDWQLPEYIADSQEFPDPEGLMERLLKKENWNTSGTYYLKEGSLLLRQMLLEYYAHEMLLQWLGDGSLEVQGYIINTCDQIEIEGEEIVIQGHCRQSGSSTAYQDH